MATANHVLLRRITLTASASSVTFDNIPQTGYTDLKLLISSRSTASVGDQMIRFNGNSSAVYAYRLYRAYDGPSTNGEAYSSQTYFPRAGYQPKSDYLANVFGNTEIYIPDYLSQNAKSIQVNSVTENNNNTAFLMQIGGGSWNVTGASSPITSITIDPSVFGGGFAAGSSFSLYGITNANTIPVSAPKADGGDIIKTDGTYWYHAFTSTGIFKPQVNLTADVLVVAGGGGGGYSYGAGGGGGGLLYFSSQALTTSSQVVTVGAGGAGVTNGNAANGGNSQFGSLTAAIGGGGGGSSVSPNVGGNGGSGGGGGAAAGAGFAGGTATSGQGFDGRSGVVGAAGGGGGAGAIAAAISGKVGGAGGAGSSTYSSWGAATGTGKNVSSTYYYAGGGSGNGESGAAAAAAGGNNQGVSGAMSTGSGAGGDAQNSTGGSGVVIIRYPV